MKKFFFLLFVVLCLVSCRTAVVEESPELETLVPVVEGSSSYDSTESVVSSGSDEASQIPTLEPQLDEGNEIAENLNVISENPSNEDPSAVMEESSNGTSGGTSSEVVVLEPSLEDSPSEQNDIVASDDMDSSMDDVDSSEGNSKEASLDGLDDTYEIPILEVSLSNAEKPVDEAVEPVVEETKDVEVETPTVQSSMQMDTKVEPSVQPNANVEHKAVEGSFMDRLTAFVLREKLFSFGVLTIFVGIVMLIVVMVSDLVRSGSRKRKDMPVQESIDEPNSSDRSETSNSHGERKENSSIDDDDEFLRSLLNS